MRTVMWLVRAEASAAIVSARFVSFVAMSCVLSVVFVYAGVVDFASRSDEAVRLAPTAASAGDPIAGRQVEPALRVVRPPEPLAVFVRGMDRAIPTSWDFSPSGAQTNRSNGASSESFSADLDLEFVVRVLLGLLAILTAADGLSGGRRCGPMRAMLSQPLAPSTVILSRIAGEALGLMLACLVVCGAGLATLATAAPDLVTHRAVAALGGFAGLSFGYCLVLYAIGACLAIIRRSTSAGLAPLAVWVAVTFVASPLTMAVASVGRGMQPSRAAELERQRVYEASVVETERDMGASLARLTPAGRSADAALSIPEVRFEIDKIWTEKASARRLTDRQPEKPPPAPWVATAALFSPSAAFSEAAARLMGTGQSTAAGWQRAVEIRQGFLERRVFDDPPRLTIRVMLDSGRQFLSYARHPPLSVSQLPAFVAPRTEPMFLFRSSAIPFLIVWATSLAALGMSVLLFRRDV